MKPREALEATQGYYVSVKVMLARRPDGTEHLVALQLWGSAFDDDPTTHPLIAGPPPSPLASPIPPRPE